MKSRLHAQSTGRCCGGKPGAFGNQKTFHHFRSRTYILSTSCPAPMVIISAACGRVGSFVGTHSVIYAFNHEFILVYM